MSGLAQRMIWLTLALCLLTGCGGGQAGVSGQSRTPDQAWGQVMAFDGQFNESCFSDDYVDINLRASKDDIAAFELDLVNKTGSQILVRWDQVVFLDASGNRQYMVHQGVAYGEPLEALEPTSLAPQASLRDILRPARLVMEGGLKKLSPLRGHQDGADYRDQRLRIDLPLEIYGRVNMYRFRFHLEQLSNDDTSMENRGQD